MSRRSFVAILGWGAFAVASLGAFVQSVRFLNPNATYVNFYTSRLKA